MKSKTFARICIYLFSFLFFTQLSCSKEEVPKDPINGGQQGTGNETDEVKYAIKIDYTYPSREKADSLLTNSKETEITVNVPTASLNQSGMRRINEDILLDAVEHLLFSLDCSRRIGALHIEVSKTINGTAADINLSLKASGVPSNFEIYSLDENGDRFLVEPNGELLCNQDPSEPSSCSFDCEFDYNCESNEEIGEFDRELSFEINDGEQISSLKIPTKVEVKETALFVNVKMERDFNPINEEIVSELELTKGQTFDLVIDRIHVRGNENCSQLLSTIKIIVPVESKREKGGGPITPFYMSSPRVNKHHLLDITKVGGYYSNQVVDGDNQLVSEEILFSIGGDYTYFPTVEFKFYYNCDKDNNFQNATSATQTYPLKLVKRVDGKEEIIAIVNLIINVELQG